MCTGIVATRCRSARARGYRLEAQQLRGLVPSRGSRWERYRSVHYCPHHAGASDYSDGGGGGGGDDLFYFILFFHFFIFNFLFLSHARTR